MTRAFKKIHVSGAGQKARHQASLSLADILPAALFQEPPAAAPRYLVLRQLTGKHMRINVDGLRLNIYRPRRLAR